MPRDIKFESRMLPPLTNPQKRHLKALAQRMDATHKVGKAGLSDAFVQNVNEALERKEIVKVKFTEFKEEKDELSTVLAEKTRSHLVMRVGNVAVLYREQPDAAKRVVKF